MKIIDANPHRGLNINILLAYYLAVGIIFSSAYISSYRSYSNNRPRIDIILLL
ncbi:MAG: hypothetical protein HY080_09800 [Gammaproteobacteria bacterium]|nr:hypothetical protein [Gammaproteobacteria bacterium]